MFFLRDFPSSILGLQDDQVHGKKWLKIKQWKSHYLSNENVYTWGWRSGSGAGDQCRFRFTTIVRLEFGRRYGWRRQLLWLRNGTRVSSIVCIRRQTTMLNARTFDFFINGNMQFKCRFFLTIVTGYCGSSVVLCESLTQSSSGWQEPDYENINLLSAIQLKKQICKRNYLCECESEWTWF